MTAAGAVDYREIDPAQPIADADFRELEKLAQEFVAQWVWFGSGPREEIAIEAERYERLGYAVSDANLRSAALHRIKGSAGNGDDGSSLQHAGAGHRVDRRCDRALLAARKLIRRAPAAAAASSAARSAVALPFSA